MKNKLFYLLLIPLFSIAFHSCSDDNKESHAEWKKVNEAYIEQIKLKLEGSNPEYFEVFDEGGPGIVYCKVIDSTECKTCKPPIYTSKVNVRYKGRLIKDKFTVRDEPFDDSSERIATFAVSGVVKGFSVALHNMLPGDKWEVVIPWYLGYGASGSSAIPPYSTLIFDLELVSISEY